jgi:hypothetical protein
MRFRLLLALLTGVLLSGGAEAQTRTAIVTSSAPDHVALTVYRSPYGKGAMNLRYLGGFALVTETRRVRLPRGSAVIRFEGVAEGIVPVSAIVDGLPGGTIEKNRDARLLSPASLVDGTLGREVTLTRTDKVSGRLVSEPATIVAGPTPGVILRTTAGIEALRCSGLAERLNFARVPASLSSKPVLSVATTSPAARTVTVRLSYLSSGFDWRASYVTSLAADGRTIDLFAWLTLANGNPEIFANADVQAVAGRLNRVAVPAMPATAGALRLVCYPLGTTTSDLRQKQFELAEEIVVTGSRVMAFALSAPVPAPPPPPPPPPPPEDLGDLKLYRVPMPTTVAARGQKQVALIVQKAVRVERRYRRAVYPGQQLAGVPTSIVLVLKNDVRHGLGVPLPAGSTALYAEQADGRLLLGLGTIGDRTIGETVRLAAGVSSRVTLTQAVVVPSQPGALASGTAGSQEAIVTASNGNSFPVMLDVAIGAAGQAIEADGDGVNRIDGISTWSPLLPPGGKAMLRYRY